MNKWMNENVRQGTFSQWRHSMANVKIYKCNFFIFAKVRPVRTKVTDKHTHTHTQTNTHIHIHMETDKPITIGEILRIQQNPTIFVRSASNQGLCSNFDPSTCSLQYPPIVPSQKKYFSCIYRSSTWQ